MPLKLIINADDFGWDDDASTAILKLAEQNTISSTTVMANLVRLEHIKELVRIPSISIGIHLNFIDGKPVSNPKEVKSLIQPDGNFYPSPKLLQKYFSGQIVHSELKTETIAQVEYLRSLGVSVSHADSHQHVHIYPGISNVILEGLLSAGITKIRRVNIPTTIDYRRFLLKIFYYSSRHNFSVVKTPDFLLSDFSICKDANNAIFIKSLHRKNGTGEMMVHPGIQQRKGSYLNRMAEYSYLMSGNSKKILEDFDVELINYHVL